MTLAFKHILVPVDVGATTDQGLAEHLVDDACAFARTTGAGKITLLHVVPPLATVSAPTDLVGDAYRSLLEVVELRKVAAGRALQELERRATNAGVSATSRLVLAPAIPRAICDAAQEAGADLIMLTTHGRRGIKRLMLGSVAERTAHLSAVPVLLIPPPVGA